MSSSSASSSATGTGTARYAERFPGHHPHFYRIEQGLTLSSLGIGSYLGNIDDATDAGYVEAVNAAVRGGINVIDTSLNYRHQSSERNIGEALASSPREEVVVCTKAGFLVPGAVPANRLNPSDIVGNIHSMAPAFLLDQLNRSLANLRLSTLDVFYLHNPETQLQFISQDEFERRIRAAFETLEQQVSQGTIRFYGTATWNGYRTKEPGAGLSLVRLERIAREVGGKSHHFRFIQLPLNLAMVEGAASPREDLGGPVVPTVTAAQVLGITAIASATLLQTKLLFGLPREVADRLPGAQTNAQRAIQFTRSIPGIAVALVGMANPEHVEENLGVASLPRADLSTWFGQA